MHIYLWQQHFPITLFSLIQSNLLCIIIVVSKKSLEFLDKLCFKRNIVLISVHHLGHLFLFLIDIIRKTILLFDSLPSTTTPYKTYQNTILQLLRAHHFYVNKSTIDFNDWKIINDFFSCKQDDNALCGIHCALLARSCTKIVLITFDIYQKLAHIIAKLGERWIVDSSLVHPEFGSVLATVWALSSKWFISKYNLPYDSPLSSPWSLC
jgi:hypothetical protein